MAKGYGIKFSQPVAAISVDREVSRTDFEEQSSVWEVDVYGISNRSSSGPAAVDADGERIDRVENVYVADPVVAARLRAISASYHAMHDAMQRQWEAEIAKLTPIEQSDVMAKVEIDR